MAKDTMSILGLYRANPTLFDNMVLPYPDVDLNRDMLINNLLMECAEYEILYTDPDFMKWAINQWSAKEINVWNKLLETTKFDYDPIANYDRNETWTDSGHIKTKTTPKGTVTYSETGYNTGTGFKNTEKVENGGTNEAENWNEVKRTGRAYGNIGVTSTQQLIEQERETDKFNIYDVIIESFKNRFCLLIY